MIFFTFCRISGTDGKICDFPVEKKIFCIIFSGNILYFDFLKKGR